MWMVIKKLLKYFFYLTLRPRRLNTWKISFLLMVASFFQLFISIVHGSTSTSYFHPLFDFLLLFFKFITFAVLNYFLTIIPTCTKYSYIFGWENLLELSEHKKTFMIPLNLHWICPFLFAQICLKCLFLVAVKLLLICFWQTIISI